ncbi:acetylornithine deacetylase [Paeniglutamicibacter psychrophenolicus]|uniref:Acetylornithine deacetylase n=1 Tax=Paeniglutamicibacter psychrophenolicus TaxID=257454 RepID=A0ABS4WDY9_9MICC|nr:acetylornithine deacetylase [Paeniglutamicibacter psychrophenolicus]MBP2374380.1 acetylornithine deacetylase [Paeniglutamicibacter psychrophenolicus]
MSTSTAPRSIDWLGTLIGFDTTSRGSNLELVNHVEAFLRSLGLDPLVVPSSTSGKANLFVSLPAADGSTQGGIMLSGHTDVVPVDGQDWHSDPFTAQVRDGRLYGRGSSDMKAFCAAILALLPEFLARPLREPVHLALTCDEEIGCHGAVELLAELTRLGIRPDKCIVGEPTMMRVISAHKSSNLYRMHFTGVATHSSLTPHGVNAIEYAARAISFIRSLADGHRTNGPFDPDFDVPHTTASTGMISGGVAVNTVPDSCTVDFEFRTIPADDPATMVSRIRTFLDEDINPAMRAENPAAGVRLEEVAMVPGLSHLGARDTGDLARRLLGSATSDKVAYATEAGIFQQAGIDTILCGPGDLAQAHTANEFIELSQITALETFLLDLAADLQARP